MDDVTRGSGNVFVDLGLNPLPCFVCGRALVLGIEPDNHPFENLPKDGLGFESEGHAQAWFNPPGDRDRLEIAVCNPCLVRHAARTRHIRLGRNHKGPTTITVIRDVNA